MVVGRGANTVRILYGPSSLTSCVVSGSSAKRDYEVVREALGKAEFGIARFKLNPQ